ncbi:MBL fold metallo-hydrolase [Paenibacillus psychroresistens]|uniref:MBL fold metallo-hydrolase n=1 Tax=Paenibacillus psychroresistens TaxID=1778678 RepID=A0A6B8RJW3_9BACL|nr:MBL fold metallo-hydrolase [Paenibacillus psychroresistens]QGQ95882.1 MBL fold metallo-hydrolase [Paenibacillus psychroresistens]
MLKSKMLALLISISLLLLGCTSTGAVDSKETVSNQIETSPVINAKAETAKADVSASGITKLAAAVKGTLKVHFIDVGQGASQLIVSPNGKTILIDAGNNDKEELIVKYLKKENVKKIDILIGTHPDADHIGGLDAVIDNFDVGKIYMPKIQANTETFKDLLSSIQKKGLKVTTAKSGLVLDWEKDINVEMIAPVGTYDDTNEMSAVIHLTYGSNSFLLTGDAEALSEADILKSKVNLKSDVLMVGHHGSKTSTSTNFLKAVNPKYAVIQVGKGNKYGHPTEEVLKKLNDKKIKIYRNDTQGNIIFSSNGKDITVKSEKAGVVTQKPTAKPTVKATTKPTPKATAKPTSKPAVVQGDVYYKNCTAVRDAGADPIYEGDPGYSSKLDRDGDGVACE